MKRSDIPEYLHRSDLYRELFLSWHDTISDTDSSDGEAEQVVIPEEYLKRDLTVSSCSELRHLLETLRYWGFSCSDVVMADGTDCTHHCRDCFESSVTLHDELLTFCFTTCESDEAVKVLREYAPQLKPLQSVVQVLGASNELMEACHCGSLRCLKWLIEHDDFTGCVSNLDLTKEMSAAAARSGHVCCLQFMLDQGCPYDESTASAALEACSEQCLLHLLVRRCPVPRSAHVKPLSDQKRIETPIPCCSSPLDIVEPTEQYLFTTAVAERGWLQSLELLQERFSKYEATKSMWESSAFTRAAAQGHAECMRFLFYGTNCPRASPTITLSCAYHGQLSCLLLALELGLQITNRICEAAALMGHRNILEAAHRHGCPMDPSTCAAAARGGHLHCLQYAHSNGCVMYSSTCTSAAACGNINCLQYAVEHDTAWGACASMAAKYGETECLRYALERGCFFEENSLLLAAEFGNIGCLQLLLEEVQIRLDLDPMSGESRIDRNWPVRTLPSELCAAAAKSGSITLVDAVLQFRWCKLTADACAEAATYGHLDCLKHLHEKHHCPWTRKTCERAARYGHLDCLKYAVAKGCRLAESVCTMAAIGGHIHCLRFLRENCDCPWNADTMLQAAKYDHEDCMRYAHEAGCPWSRHVCEVAARYGNIDCLQYAVEYGCPIGRWTIHWAERAVWERRDPQGLCLRYSLEKRINTLQMN